MSKSKKYTEKDQHDVANIGSYVMSKTTLEKTIEGEGGKDKNVQVRFMPSISITPKK